MTKSSVLMGVALVSLPASSLPAQTLQEFSASKHGSEVTVFASGNVRDVVGEPGSATSATGSLGVTFRGSHYIVSGLVNALARNDTVTSGYGTTLLPPATGRAFNSALVEIRRQHFPGFSSNCGIHRLMKRLCQVGIHGYVSASAGTWATAKDTAGKVTAAVEVPTWGTGIGVYYNFFDGYINDSTRVGMALDLTYAQRHLRGDFGSRKFALLRDTLLGTTRRNFDGLETGLNIRYNEINASLTYYAMSGNIAGFSNGQVVAAVSIRARLNSGAYTEQPKEKPKSEEPR